MKKGFVLKCGDEDYLQYNFVRSSLSELVSIDEATIFEKPKFNQTILEWAEMKYKRKCEFKPVTMTVFEDEDS